jgi:DNA polymerase-1
MKRIVAREGQFPYPAARALAQLNPSVVAFDTETTSLKWYEQQVEGVSVCDGNTVVYVDITTEEQKEALRDFFTKTVVLIGHNITFDAKALRKLGIDIFDKEWLDTMVAEHLIDERSEKSLKKMAERYLNAESVQYEEAAKAGIHSQKFAEYAMNDAEWTWRIFHMQKHQLQEQGLVPLMRDIEMPFLKALAEMEMNGIALDVKRAEKITRQLYEVSLKLEVDMLEYLGERYSKQITLTGVGDRIVSDVNLSSTQQLQEILFHRLGLPEVTDPKTKSITVGKEFIKQYKSEAGEAVVYSHPFVELLDKYRGASKLLSAFFEPMPTFIDKDKRVRPSFRDCGTKTGRLSCQEPNLQQLPKSSRSLGVNTRSCFVASPGKKLIAIDYSQQEIRIMADLSRDPTLIRTVVEGGDLHLLNANAVFNLGIPVEELITSHPEYKKHKKKYSKERDMGKIFSFGVGYGMTEHKIARDFKITLEEAKRLLDNFWAGYPELKRAMDETHKAAEKYQYVATKTGRRRRFELDQWGRVDHKGLRQSFNFLIQSYGADLIRTACIKIREYGRSNPDLGIALLMTVHDEVVLECNEAYADEVSAHCVQLMESCGDLCVPLVAEAQIASDYGACK